MNKSQVFFASAAGLLLSIAALPLAAGGNSETADPGVQSGTRFELHLEPGPHHSARQGFWIFGYTVQPQAAVWVETLEGEYVDTIYVTAKGQKGDWTAAPKNGRPEALPVWYHLDKESTDAVSSATPEEDTLYGSDLAARLAPGKYIIKMETNRSYDYNEAFTESMGVGGQPSLVYQAELYVGESSASAEFRPAGTGSPDGSDGLIRPGLEGITTALELFSSMEIRYLE
jgi:hypothetical protein